MSSLEQFASDLEQYPQAPEGKVFDVRQLRKIRSMRKETSDPVCQNTRSGKEEEEMKKKSKARPFKETFTHLIG